VLDGLLYAPQRYHFLVEHPAIKRHHRDDHVLDVPVHAQYGFGLEFIYVLLHYDVKPEPAPPIRELGLAHLPVGIFPVPPFHVDYTASNTPLGR